MSDSLQPQGLQHSRDIISFTYSVSRDKHEGHFPAFAKKHDKHTWVSTQAYMNIFLDVVFRPTCKWILT